MNTLPAVSVVIPARDATETLEQAVASALGQDYGGPLEVVVAVAAGDVETRAVADGLAVRHESVRVVDNPAGTAPVGLNAAWRAATGSVIARLDAHARFPDGYLRRAVELLADTGAANVGGRQVPTAAGGFGMAVAVAMASPLGSGGARYRVGGQPGEVDTVYLGVFDRQALEAVGGFDETLIRNQDYELNHRLRQSGRRVYFHPDLAVTYRPRSDVAGLARQYLDYGAWKRRVAGQHPESLRIRQLAAPMLVAGLVAVWSAAVVVRRWWLAVATTGGYLTLLVAGGVQAVVTVDGSGDGPQSSTGSTSRPWPGPRSGWGRLRLAGGVVIALAVMHLAWGVGFLLGGRVRRPGPGGG